MINPNVLLRIINDVPVKQGDEKKEIIPREVKATIRKRDKEKCRVCDRDSDKVHHIIPNGKATEDNLIVLCDQCHEYVHKMLRRKGYPFYIPRRVRGWY